VIERLGTYRDERFGRLDVARSTLNNQLSEAIDEKNAFEGRYEYRRTVGTRGLQMPGNRRLPHDYDIVKVREKC
jgi:hypothetical protein